MPPPINADISSILDEKFGKNKLELFSQKEIEESISSSANYEELYQNSLEVLQKMEENFFNFYGERFIFDRELDTTNPITIFEQEGAEILEDSKRIVWDNSISDASLTMVERLSNIQKEVIADIEKDKEDGTINNKHTIGVNGIIHQWKGMGNDLFWMREDNLTEFSNHIKGLSDKDLLIRALNMPEGTGAFNDLYKRLTKRMGEKKIDNIFNMIDTIAEEWGEGNDQIKDSLTISCITTLLTRDKVNDLEKWVNSYSEKDKLLALMGEGISLNEDLKKGFLQQYYTLKDMPLFEKLVNSVVNNDSRIGDAINLRSEYEKTNVDIFTSGKINGLFLFDNAGHGGGGEFYQRNVDKFKEKGFKIEQEEDDAYMKKIILKKGDDRLTLVLLKYSEDGIVDYSSGFFGLNENYDTAIEKLKTEDYNLFALRGHCYNTDEMAYALGKHKMVGVGDLFIDGGCNNANKVPEYKERGINGSMFAYSGQGRGAVTEAFVDKIFEIKNRREGGNFQDLLGFYQEKRKGKPDEQGHGYFAHNVIMPNSLYYYYYVYTHDKA